MNDQLKEIRATLEQVRALMPAPVTGPHVNIAINRLANALDVLTGEVEQLNTCTKALAVALEGVLGLIKLLKERVTEFS